MSYEHHIYEHHIWSCSRGYQYVERFEGEYVDLIVHYYHWYLNPRTINIHTLIAATRLRNRQSIPVAE